MRTAPALDFLVLLFKGPRPQRSPDGVICLLVEGVENSIQVQVVQTQLGGGVLLCAAPAASELGFGEGVEVDGASVAGVKDEALTFGGDRGGELGG